MMTMIENNDDDTDDLDHYILVVIITMIYMIFIQCINKVQAEINSLDNDLAVFPLVIQSLGRVQAPWIDLRGNIT